MNLRTIAKVWVLALAAAAPSIGRADNADWVIGNVALIEDVRAHWPASGILVQLSNKSYYSTGGMVQNACTERYRIVVNQEGVIEEIQKSFTAILLAARLSGEKVRLLVNPDNVTGTGNCAVRAVSMGDF